MIKREESLICMTSQSKRLPNFIWAIILVLIFMNLGSIIGLFASIPIYKLLNLFSISPQLIKLFLTLFSFLFISLLVFIRVKLIEKRSISTLGFTKDCWLRKYIQGFIIGFTMMSVLVFLLFVLGYISVEKNPNQPTGVSSIGGVLFILLGWIIQGSSEEIVTRGWLMNVLGARYNSLFGLIVSSTLFGLMHLLNPQVNYIAILNIILAGFFFGIYAMKTNNLWSVCGIHTAWNFTQGNIFGFEVSGLNIEVSSIFDLNLIGNNIITGGSFGPEAGIAATFILTLSITIIFILDNRGYFSKFS